MYEIRPESVKTFISDKSIKLPRYQRKQTWDDKKNFELAVSLFRGYPLGVVVINKEFENGNSTKWLIDGRQRRNALIDLEKDPELIYTWAKKYIRFKANDHQEEIDIAYREKIEEYLGKDFDEDNDFLEANNKVEQDSTENDFTEDDEEFDEETFKKLDGLDLLKKIIFTVHRLRKNYSGFSKIFDFSEYVENLNYVVVEDGRNTLKSVNLKKWIQYYLSSAEKVSQDSLYQFVDSSLAIRQNKKKNFKKHIENNWDQLKLRINLIEQIDKVLQDAKIGLIELSNTTLVDSQKIFEIINTKGTKLSAVEVLSAKPQWNYRIKNPSNSLVNFSDKLYKLIGVETKYIVRWDIPATLIDRLEDSGLIFKDYDDHNGNDLEKKVTLGFKLFSALKVSGISKISISELSDMKIDWEREPETMIQDLNEMFRVIGDLEFFKYLGLFGTNIMSLLSDAITLNYVTILYMDWLRKNKPSGSSRQRKQFEKNAFVLLDRFLFEYLQQFWRGSSDARVARNIENFKNSDDLLKPVDSKKWESLLNDMIDNHRINDTVLATSKVDGLLKSFIVFYASVKKLHPSFLKEDDFDFDHIIPQAYIDRIHNSDKEKWKNNLVNLCLLPKTSNVKKKDKKLNEIDDTTLSTQVSQMTEIPHDQFGRYSNIDNIDDFIQFRKEKLLEFIPNRAKILNS